MTLLGSHPNRTLGAGEVPLVLLHGFPLDHRMWRDVQELLVAHSVPAVALDAPGFGDSPPPQDVAAALGGSLQEPNLELVADAVAHTLGELGVARAVVAGLSMGGYITLALAERHPGLLAGVGLLDTKAKADPEAVVANRFRIADAVLGPAGNDAVAPMIETLIGTSTKEVGGPGVEELRGWLATAPVASIAWANRAMAVRPERFAALEALRVPGLVVRGAEDALASQEDAEAMVAALTSGGGSGELVVIPRAGHMTATEDPAGTSDALAALWRRATSSS